MGKKLILILAIIIISIIVTTVITVLQKETGIADSIKTGNNYKDENGVKINTSKKIAEDKIVDGIKIEKGALKYQNGVSTLTSIVTNNTNQEKDIIFDITFVDSNGKEILTIDGYIGDLGPGEKRTLNSSVTNNVSNAEDVVYKFKK